MKKIQNETKSPSHLYSPKSIYISSIEIEDSKYYALLPNKGAGYKIQIDLATFQEIQNLWEENEITLLNYNFGQIIGDNLIINSKFKVYREEQEPS